MDEIQFSVNPESLAAVSGLSIEANFEECKSKLEKMMQPYSGMVVTEDGVAAAKADRAKINKIAARIDEARKTVKAAYMTPLADFEEKSKQLMAICTKASGNLDQQVKCFEQAQRESRLLSIRRYFEENVGDAAQYLTWEDVMNAKWGNISYGMDKAMREVKEAIDTCIDDLTTIRRMESSFEATLLDLYKSTHNLSACIRKNQELSLIQEQERRRKAAQEETQRQQKSQSQWIEQMRADAVRNSLKYENPDHERIIAQEAAPKAQDELVTNEPEPVMELDFRCYVTKRQMEELRVFLTEHGIKFGRVPKECRCCAD